ncbi:MAG TPA: glycosyltransferase [Candidatus Hydrogenedentes bacterium]|nr:glycosyltransferase [Candidatus Hydrogenedentota bacterium]
MDDKIDISVVVPVYNEAPNLNALYQRIVATLDKLNRSFEIIAVDDGSTDGSLDFLRALQQRDPRLRVVRLARNFGQTPALYAGFAHVRGRMVVQLDADLQNPPEEMVKLIEKLEEGYDVVQGWREDRRDTLARRLPSRMLNRAISLLMGAKIRDLGCGLKAFRRDVVERMSGFTHHARYLPAEMLWLGVRMAEVKVEHRERAGGESKYGLFSLLRLNFDIISSISTAPIKIIGLVGGLLSLVGFFMGILIFVRRIIDVNYDPLAGSIASVTALFFILAGVQMIATGIMCEYIGRIFVEVQNKPYYIVKEVIEESPTSSGNLP